MSTAATPPKFHFLVYAPDKTDEEAFERRLSVRVKHLENAKKLAAAGVLKSGGALLTPESIATADAERRMCGSTLILEATTLDEVTRIVESDIYYKSDVWDPERIVILPYVPAQLGPTASL